MTQSFLRTNFAKLFAAIVALALTNAGPEATAVDNEMTRATLKGLPGVYVSRGVCLGRIFSEQDKVAGFDERTFQTDVELKLRLAGIKVLTEEEQLATPGMPILYLHVNALHKQPGQNHAYSISLGLQQAVRLVRNGALAYGARTWSVNSVGYGDLPFIRNAVKDYVDQFINAWLSVNPKPKIEPSKDSPQKEN